MASLKTVAVVTALLLTSCGEGLKPTAYEGEPMFTIEGTMIENSVGYPVEGLDLKFALFWHVGRALSGEESEVVEDRATTRAFTPPARFVMQVYRPPETLGPRNYSFGVVLIYEDANHNGRRDPSEVFHGGVTSTIVSYAPSPIPPERGWLRQAVPQGFSTVALPLACYDEQVPRSPERCSVPVGAGCVQDADCQAPAVCAESVISTRLPGGMCVLMGSEPEGEVCGRDARFLPVFGGSWLRLIEPVEGIWLPACESDADCPRRGYHCALGVDVCLPSPVFEVFPTGSLPPLCMQDFEDAPPGFGDYEPPEEEEEEEEPPPDEGDFGE